MQRSSGTLNTCINWPQYEDPQLQIDYIIQYGTSDNHVRGLRKKALG